MVLKNLFIGLASEVKAVESLRVSVKLTKHRLDEAAGRDDRERQPKVSTKYVSLPSLTCHGAA